MCPSSQRYSPSLERHSLVPLPSLKMGQGWTSPLMASGEAPLSVPSLMFECSIPMPHRIVNPSTLVTGNTKTSKKRAYEQRIREVEHGTFTPLVMSLTGGLGNAATVCYKRLASLLCAKWNQPYNSTMAWIRCRLTFSLLRSAIQCIRGARSAGGHASREFHPLDLISAEAQFA